MAKPNNPETSMIDNILTGGEKMLTVPAVAAIACVKEERIRLLIRKGVIPAYRIGGFGKYLIPESYIREQLSTPVKP